MTHAYCPECDSKIAVGNKTEEGQAVKCPNCGAKLMIIDTSPLELDWAYEDDDLEMEIELEDDDFDDYDEDFDDYDEDLDDL